MHVSPQWWGSGATRHHYSRRWSRNKCGSGLSRHCTSPCAQHNFIFISYIDIKTDFFVDIFLRLWQYSCKILYRASKMWYLCIVFIMLCLLLLVHLMTLLQLWRACAFDLVKLSNFFKGKKWSEISVLIMGDLYKPSWRLQRPTKACKKSIIVWECSGYPNFMDPFEYMWNFYQKSDLQKDL